MGEMGKLAVRRSDERATGIHAGSTSEGKIPFEEDFQLERSSATKARSARHGIAHPPVRKPSTSSSKSATSEASLEGLVLSLQRTAGNRAVATLVKEGLSSLGRGAGPVERGSHSRLRGHVGSPIEESAPGRATVQRALPAPLGILARGGAKLMPASRSSSRAEPTSGALANQRSPLLPRESLKARVFRALGWRSREGSQAGRVASQRLGLRERFLRAIGMTPRPEALHAGLAESVPHPSPSRSSAPQDGQTGRDSDTESVEEGDQLDPDLHFESLGNNVYEVGEAKHKYTLRNTGASGGFGKIFHLDPHPDNPGVTPLVIKVPHSPNNSDSIVDEYRGRKALGDMPSVVQHYGLVSVPWLSESKGIVMERLKISLRDCYNKLSKWREVGGISEMEYQGVARYLNNGVIKALSQLQEGSFVHYDLKPENVMLDENYDVKLIDISALKEGDDDTPAAYTPAYQSPEATSWSGPRRTHKNDMYAAGIMAAQIQAHNVLPDVEVVGRQGPPPAPEKQVYKSTNEEEDKEKGQPTGALAEFLRAMTMPKPDYRLDASTALKQRYFTDEDTTAESNWLAARRRGGERGVAHPDVGPEEAKKILERVITKAPQKRQQREIDLSNVNIPVDEREFRSAKSGEAWGRLHEEIRSRRRRHSGQGL